MSNILAGIAAAAHIASGTPSTAPHTDTTAQNVSEIIEIQPDGVIPGNVTTIKDGETVIVTIPKGDPELVTIEGGEINTPSMLGTTPGSCPTFRDLETSFFCDGDDTSPINHIGEISDDRLPTISFRSGTPTPGEVLADMSESEFPTPTLRGGIDGTTTGSITATPLKGSLTGDEFNEIFGEAPFVPFPPVDNPDTIFVDESKLLDV